MYKKRFLSPLPPTPYLQTSQHLLTYNNSVKNRHGAANSKKKSRIFLPGKDSQKSVAPQCTVYQDRRTGFSEIWPASKRLTDALSLQHAAEILFFCTCRRNSHSKKVGSIVLLFSKCSSDLTFETCGQLSAPHRYSVSVTCCWRSEEHTSELQSR